MLNMNTFLSEVAGYIKQVQEMMTGNWKGHHK